jgi:hypothetical protein
MQAQEEYDAAKKLVDAAHALVTSKHSEELRLDRAQTAVKKETESVAAAAKDASAQFQKKEEARDAIQLSLVYLEEGAEQAKNEVQQMQAYIEQLSAALAADTPVQAEHKPEQAEQVEEPKQAEQEPEQVEE